MYEKIIHIESAAAFEPYVSLTIRLQREHTIDDDTIATIIRDASAEPKFRSVGELKIRLTKELALYGIQATFIQPEKPAFEIAETAGNIRITKRNKDFTV